MSEEQDARRHSDDRAGPSRTVQLAEVVVFLLLVVPAAALTPSAVPELSLPFWFVAVSTIARNVALTSLIAYFLWRNREPFGALGLRFPAGWREWGLGVLLFPAFFLATGLIARALQLAGFPSPPPRPEYLIPAGLTEYLLATVLTVVVAVAEETIYRGYLLLRLAAVAGNLPVAIALATVIFALGHGYQGVTGVVTVGAMGLFLTLVYLWRRSLAAPVMLHFLQNFTALVLLPLFGGRP